MTLNKLLISVDSLYLEQNQIFYSTAEGRLPKGVISHWYNVRKRPVFIPKHSIKSGFKYTIYFISTNNYG